MGGFTRSHVDDEVQASKGFEQLFCLSRAFMFGDDGWTT